MHTGNRVFHRLVTTLPQHWLTGFALGSLVALHLFFLTIKNRSMQQATERKLSAVPTPEQQALDALHHFKEVLTDMGELRESLQLLKKTGFTQTPNCRSLKIQRQIRNNSEFPVTCVPSLTLTGNWLYNAGFDYEQRVQVITMKDLIIICPDGKPEERRRRLR